MGLEEEIIVRKYQRGDAGNIVELLDSVHNGWPKEDIEGSNSTYWMWKYFEGPKPSLISVAEHQGNIIGTIHARQLNIKIENKLYPCTTTCDLVVRKDYRGLGLSKRLGIGSNREWRRSEGTILDYFIVGNPILVKSFDKTRPKFPIKIINLVKIEDIADHFENNPSSNSLLLRRGYSFLKQINKVLSQFISIPSSNPFEISPINEFDDRINEFWNRLAKEYDFIVERNLESLNHRYCHEKNRKYRVFQASRRGKIIGFIALRVNSYNQEYPVGYVTDLLCFIEEEEAVKALLIEGLNYFKENGVNLINIQLPLKHPYVNIARKMGFLDSRVQLHIYYIPAGNFDPFKGIRFRPEKVYMSWGDHDVLPPTIPKYE